MKIKKLPLFCWQDRFIMIGHKKIEFLMDKTALLAKMQQLQREVERITNANNTLLEEHQYLKNQLFQFIRMQEEVLCGLKEDFNIQVQTLRQEFAKLNNEYRQHLSGLRANWIQSFPLSAPNTHALRSEDSHAH